MKRSLVFIGLLTLVVTLTSSTQKASRVECFITFSKPDGTEITKNGYDARFEDWSLPIVRAEFRKGEQAVDHTGIFVYVPEQGEVLVREFNGNDQLTKCFREEMAKDVPVIKLRRIIIDNIREPENKRNISPLVYTIHKP